MDHLALRVEMKRCSPPPGGGVDQFGYRRTPFFRLPTLTAAAVDLLKFWCFSTISPATVLRKFLERYSRSHPGLVSVFSKKQLDFQ